MRDFLFLVALALSAFANADSASLLIKPGSSAVLKSGTLQEDIGIETLGGVFTPLLKSGCKLPCSIRQTFSTAVDDQDQIIIHLFIGKGPLIKNARSLGTFQIRGIPPMQRGEPKISFEIGAATGGINLEATDQSGRSNLSLVRIAP